MLLEKIKVITISFVIGLIGNLCSNNSINNESSPSLSNVAWKSSGCLEKKEPSFKNTGDIKIQIIQSDTSTIVNVPITTYCSTEFVCYDKIFHDTIELRIKNETELIAFCMCDYNLEFCVNKEIQVNYARVIIDIHNEVNPACTLIVDYNK